MQVSTVLGAEKETTNTVRYGDIYISGPQGESYIIRAKDFLRLYNINEGIATPRKQPRKVAKVTKRILKELDMPMSILFKAPWGEDMLLNAGDYLVKDTNGNGGVYRVEAKAFTQTYWIKDITKK